MIIPQQRFIIKHDRERDWSEGELSVLKPWTRYLTNNINILPHSIVACFAGLHSLNN